MASFSPPEAVIYPRREFHAETRKVQTTGGFGGEAPRRFTQLKFTFPGLDIPQGKRLEYDLRVALVLQGATIRNDLNGIVHHATIKGIGAPEDKQRKPENLGVREAAEVVFDQVGLGSAQALIKALANRFHFHVENSISHRIDLVVGHAQHGTIDTDTRVLHDTDHLRANGFDARGFKLPDHASQVVLARVLCRMSRDQVATILAEASNIPWRYDRTPRLVLRIDHPDSLYDNWNSPRARMFALFRTNQDKETTRRTAEVPLPPLQRSYVRD